MTYAENVNEIKTKLRELFPETPLQYSKFLSDRYGANVYLKREDLTPVRSYKIRGAFNFIDKFLVKNPKQKEFVCASAGNHAQGFAFACKHFQRKGLVYMPTTTPGQKITKTKVAGGDWVDVVLEGDVFDDALNAAKAYSSANSVPMVPPFDHEWITEGQATIGSEILDQVDFSIDVLMIPVGGGGLSAGILPYFTEVSPKTKVYLAETSGAPALHESLKVGDNIILDQIDTFADGTAVKQIGDYTFGVLQKHYSDEVLLASEDRICQTMLDFLSYDGIIMEPAGALAIDALKNLNPKAIKGKNIVCVLSGGNFDFSRLAEVKERAMKFSGRKKYFILRLPQRPGALKEFLNCLGSGDDIARFEYLKKSSKAFGSVLLGIETDDSKNFETLFGKLTELGFQYQDVTDDEILGDFVI